MGVPVSVLNDVSEALASLGVVIQD